MIVTLTRLLQKVRLSVTQNEHLPAIRHQFDCVDELLGAGAKSFFRGSHVKGFEKGFFMAKCLDSSLHTYDSVQFDS